ncbi:MAG: SRPBCC family protein [Marinovum sp.]|nr:SRPBCC family protein [Marinovum sp.]
MEFVAKEDINSGIDEVFAILSDVDSIERQALRRSVEVRRITPHTILEPGMAWEAKFKFRGRQRGTQITLREFVKPSLMVFGSVTGGLETSFRVEFLELTKGTTRVTMQADLQPKTLSARLLVQSMKLAKSKIQRRYSVRMSQLAKDIEERASRLA